MVLQMHAELHSDWMYVCDEKDNSLNTSIWDAHVDTTIMFTNLSSCLYHLIGRIWMPNSSQELLFVHFRLQMLLMYYSIFPQTVIFFGSTRFVSYWSFRILSSCQCQICQCKELLLIRLRLLLRPFQGRFSSVIITSLHADSKPVWCYKPRILSKSPVTNRTDLTLGILSMYPKHQKCH